MAGQVPKLLEFVVVVVVAVQSEAHSVVVQSLLTAAVEDYLLSPTGSFLCLSLYALASLLAFQSLWNVTFAFSMRITEKNSFPR